MPHLTKADLNYDDYSWTAVPGDDPRKTVADADRFSRHEGYEVLNLLNSLTGQNGVDLAVHTRRVCEWMVHEKLPSNIQGRVNVKNWIAQNFTALLPSYPHARVQR